MSGQPAGAMPFVSFPGKIHLIDSDQKLQAVATEMARVTAFGFDTETRPSFRKGEVYSVALLQLATETDAYLVRLRGVRQTQVLKSIFENESITKVGVAIRDDLKQLQKLFPFTPKGFVELQDVAKKMGLKNFGLKGMTEEVLQATISKSSKLTNWEAAELAPPQLKYAATDAWIGLRLYSELKLRETPA